MAGIREPIPLEDARDVVNMMIYSGRVIPPDRWIDSMRLQGQVDTLSAFGA